MLCSDVELSAAEELTSKIPVAHSAAAVTAEAAAAAAVAAAAVAAAAVPPPLMQKPSPKADQNTNETTLVVALIPSPRVVKLPTGGARRRAQGVCVTSGRGDTGGGGGERGADGDGRAARTCRVIRRRHSFSRYAHRLREPGRSTYAYLPSHGHLTTGGFYDVMWVLDNREIL